MLETSGLRCILADVSLAGSGGVRGVGDCTCIVPTLSALREASGPQIDRIPPTRPPYEDPAATLDDLREAVTTLEDTVRIARRVLGGAHPITSSIEAALRQSRAVLRARETPPTNA